MDTVKAWLALQAAAAERSGDLSDHQFLRYRTTYLRVLRQKPSTNLASDIDNNPPQDLAVMPAHLGQLQPNFSDDEELTDEQIHALLKDAEHRMREHSSSTLTQHEKDTSFKGLPKPRAEHVEEPYIQTNGDIASVDQSRLLPANQRKLANKVRKIEDPIMVKKRTITVIRYFFLCASTCLVMRIFSNLVLTQTIDLVLSVYLH